jgi:hypothetical protein
VLPAFSKWAAHRLYLISIGIVFVKNVVFGLHKLWGVLVAATAT